ncbi:MAG: 5'-nucleotidase [Rhodobacteraceae bacterium]|nr:5'-nucleotidase [Paracoccaceae bacterium]
MSLDLSSRLVVGVASSALFDLSESDAVFRAEGEAAYRAHQRDRLDEALPKGVAFPFLSRLLGLNAVRPDDPPVEAILLSRNDPDTGRRTIRSAAGYGLDITRAAFLSGGSPGAYLSAFHCELFLSANEADVRAAVAADQPAGYVLPPPTSGGGLDEGDDDDELRIAFDFDGVLADDASERVFVAEGVDGFRAHEETHRDAPISPGPLKPFLTRVAQIQALERDRKDYRPRLKTSLVNARGAPAHERVVTTLDSWGVRLDSVFFLGGVEKTDVLRTLRPHVFFDDQRTHLDRASTVTPAIHIPFGVKNTAPI